MPIDSAEVEIGGIYSAGNGQIRKVIGLLDNRNGDTKVEYEAKSGNIRNRKFELGHNKSQPPSLDSFCNACHSRLNDEEIGQLVVDEIVTREEVT